MSNTFATLISETAKSALNRAVENHNAVEARAKDVADWYMARKAEAEAEAQRREAEIDQMERDFIHRFRTNQDGLRDELEQAWADLKNERDSNRIVIGGSGRDMITAVINYNLRHNVGQFQPVTIDQLRTDRDKYIKSMTRYASCK